MSLTLSQRSKIFIKIIQMFKEFNATPNDMIEFLGNSMLTILATHEFPKEKVFEIFDSLKESYEEIETQDTFLNHLQSVFDEYEEALEKAFQCLEDNSTDDGMLFSKEFRERMSKFGDMDAKDMLNNTDFWNELLDYAGISQEEKDKLMNRE